MAIALLGLTTLASPASANCGHNGKDVGEGCEQVDPPSATNTPELDSVLLFGSGLAGLGGYGLMRLRAQRKPH